MKFFENFFIVFVSLLVLPLFALSADSPVVQQHSEVGWYLFTSFRGGGDGLHLALSRDGYNWKALRNDEIFLKANVGGSCMRDPSIAEGPDHVFRLVWTSGWTVDRKPQIGYCTTTNFVDWTPQKGISLMENFKNVRNVWAPELFYDENEQLWYIIWSSTVTGYDETFTNISEDKYNHRAYYATTKDFETFSESKIYFEPHINMIDSTLIRNGKQYILFFKDERLNPVEKNLRMAFADSPEGPFEGVSAAITTNWVEGPSVLKIGDTWLCYFDHYASPHYYGAIRSTDLKNWEDCSKECVFPKDHRHGTVITITKELGEKLLGL